MRQRWRVLCRQTLRWRELRLAAVSAGRAVHRRAASAAIPGTNAKALLGHRHFRSFGVANTCAITGSNQDADAATHTQPVQCTNCHANDVPHRGADRASDRKPDASPNQVAHDAADCSANAATNGDANTVADVCTDVVANASSAHACADPSANANDSLQPWHVPVTSADRPSVAMRPVPTGDFQHAPAQLECHSAVPAVLAWAIRHRWLRQRELHGPVR